VVAEGGWTYLDLVKFESSDYMVLSYHGDSGGPVTTEPYWNSTVGYYDANAAGVFVGGSYRGNGPSYEDRPCIVPDDGSCPAYYMAIDRIDDFESVRILTPSGPVTP
jgi:hypothetical protein